MLYISNYKIKLCLSPKTLIIFNYGLKIFSFFKAVYVNCYFVERDESRGLIYTRENVTNYKTSGL